MTAVNTGDTITASDFPVYARSTPTTDAAGEATIAFGVTFSSPPTVVTTVQRSATAAMVAHILSVTTTDVTVAVTSNDARLTSTAVNVHWVAIGPRA